MNENIPLSDGNSIPNIGLGVFKMPAGETVELVKTAIRSGYRAVDTAAMYGNEEEVGEAVRASEDPIFVTTKLWHSDHGYDAALAAFDRGYAKLGLEQIDLCLIHWPAPARNLYVDTWNALIRLRDEGRVRSIGVSNFGVDQLERLVRETGVMPVVNQVELHPCFQQRALRAFHAEEGIATICWGPLGQGRELATPAIIEIAKKHARTPAQIVLRWHVETGLIPIPKSSNPARQAENIAIFEFALDADDHGRIAALDDPAGRFGPDPMLLGN